MTAPDLADVARAICAELGFAFIGPAGQGAFKQTFQVEIDKRAHALKVYKPGFPIDRTEREFKAIALCSHPNIGGLTAVSPFSFKNEAYLFTLEEFLPGGTLSSKLTTVGRLSPAETKDIGIAMIDAVSHVAGHGLVHRDIKPENILFKDEKTPVLVDFGLVRDLRNSSLTQTWLMRGPGTPLFAPPEQLLNEKVLIDWRSDQFSLGVTLSYVAFGHHPYWEPGMADGDVVERVAQRVAVSQTFRDRAESAGLPVIAAMVQPWPVQRVRLASSLSSAWAAQEPH